MNREGQACFVLIDGVLRHDAIPRLYQRGESLEVEPIYLCTRWAELHDIGPILVAVRGPSMLIDETCQTTDQVADASLVYSHASLRVVADHLRRFIAPTDILGRNGLLRFADPLVTRFWLSSYQGVHLDAVLGPIDAWHVPENPHSWEPTGMVKWQRFLRTAAPPEWIDGHGLLGQAQLDAMDRAARWRFIDRLHDHLQQSHSQRLAKIDAGLLTQWFDDRLDEAQAWGLTSERSHFIWIKYSLRWGAGFTLGTCEPYQRWLASTPAALKLLPDSRIQQMDHDCLNIESNKDVSL